jgi:ferric-dicitrate binding protein FerR (iron transport regulator)
MNDRRLKELIELHLNGCASAEDSSELEQRLRGDAAARSYYLYYMNLHSALRRRFLANEEATLADFRCEISADRLSQIRPKRRWLVAVSLIAAVFVICAIAWNRWTSDPWRVAAVVENVSGDAQRVAASSSTAVRVGDSFSPGTTLRLGEEDCRVTLFYPDGTRIFLHNGCVVQSPTTGDVRLQLLAGSMEVDAAEQPADRPLVLLSGSTRYVVLGTRFRLYRESEASRLELDEGEVRLERPGDKAVDVKAGNVAISADELPVEVVPLAAGTARLQTTLKHASQKVEFSSAETWLVGADFERGLKTWEIESLAEAQSWQQEPRYADALAFGKDGEIVRVNKNGEVLVWHSANDSSTKLKLPGEQFRSVAISPDATAIAASPERSVAVYQIAANSESLEPRFSQPQAGKAWCLSLTPGGQQLAAGFWDGTVRVYDVDGGDLLFEQRLKHTPTQISLAPEADRLAVFTQKDGLKLIYLQTGVQHELWPPASELIRTLRFSADGKYVLAGMNDHTARIWGGYDGRQLLVADVGFSPQGIAWSEKHQLLAVADGTVKLWKCTLPAVNIRSEAHR